MVSHKEEQKWHYSNSNLSFFISFYVFQIFSTENSRECKHTSSQHLQICFNFFNIYKIKFSKVVSCEVWHSLAKGVFASLQLPSGAVGLCQGGQGKRKMLFSTILPMHFHIFAQSTKFWCVWLHACIFARKANSASTVWLDASMLVW
jgi:hypothetical protein